MKKNILILLIFILSFSTFAQNGERIKALKVAFITERLDLTQTEAQKFWPIYNNLEKEREKLRKESKNIRKDLNFETLTDNEANTLIKKMLAIEEQKHKLQVKQINDLLEVLPPKKVILLKATEDAFNRRMLEQIKKRKERFNRD